MTDNLSAKFTELEGQIQEHHNELMAKLDAIALALPPPAPPGAATLGDVVSAINNLSLMLGAWRSDQADQLGAVISLGELISTNLETMLQNSSTNAQLILRAIQLNDPCKSCEGTQIGLPPIDTTPQTVDQEHCRRMQKLIYDLRAYTVKLDILSTFGAGFSTTILQDALNEVLTELGFGSGQLMPSFSEIAALAAAGATYIAGNVFVGHSLPALYNLFSDDLLMPLYNADNASEGQAVYRDIVNSAPLSATEKPIFSALGYIEIFNYYYDRTQPLNTAGFDGTICGGSNCDVLWDLDFAGNPPDVTTDIYSGYEEVSLNSTATAGAGQVHLYVDGELRYSGSSPCSTIEPVSGSEFYVTVTAPNYSAGRLHIEGCPAKNLGN